MDVSEFTWERTDQVAPFVVLEIILPVVSAAKKVLVDGSWMMVDGEVLRDTSLIVQVEVVGVRAVAMRGNGIDE